MSEIIKTGAIEVVKTEVKEKKFFFHSNLNTELVTDKTQKDVIKLINKSLRVTLGDTTKKAIRNILDQCETSKHRRMTVCGVVIDNRLHIGVSVCSEHDNFSKEIGRAGAYKQATIDPIDILMDWEKRCNAATDKEGNKAFINYCIEIAVPSYLNAEEYRRDKSIEKTIKDKTVKPVVKLKWYQKILNLV